MPVQCPNCESQGLELVEELDDGRRRLRCSSCGHEWLRGEARRVYRTATTITDLKATFPSPDDVQSARVEHVTGLRARFLQDHPDRDPKAVAFRERYRALFAPDELQKVSPEDLKYFANANLAANPGTMTVFNDEWNRLGPTEAARTVREAIAYLLYGPDNTFIEDRLTNLIVGRRGMGMKGFREALLTKVLCMVYPERMLPILMYTGLAGKKEIAESVYGLRLPAPESVSGRLVG